MLFALRPRRANFVYLSFEMSNFVLSKIVSGGQTGVDQAALEAAIAMGVEHGGWCLSLIHI